MIIDKLQALIKGHKEIFDVEDSELVIYMGRYEFCEFIVHLSHYSAVYSSYMRFGTYAQIKIVHMSGVSSWLKINTKEYDGN